MSATPIEPEISRMEVGKDASLRVIAMRIFRAEPASAFPALIWLGGYRSDMTGTKAVEVERHARAVGADCIRFDYSGHGASGGEFRDGTISRWLEEGLAVVDHATSGRVILIGSSMGAWVALRLVEELRRRGEGQRVAGLVLIAPAPDFTAELIEPNLTEAEKASLAEQGYFEEPSEYSPEPNIFTRALIEDGRDNRVMNGPIETGCPVHILQGMRDPDVPYTHALRLMEHMPSDDVVMTLIRDGDHRLSREEDIAKLKQAIDSLIAKA
ncbi:2-hydroxymuconic semialdehyde hydrolase [Sinorhizobium sojae CCBAU 05684]|uniref:Palmitoyl-protein thioesterase ABHD10, mitochondrial n=1 Tax=Sinorhizobium sojae CCBAU 05684 TaxID=716928 RepID=A0A249PH76_9HYPH|nr:alpha/beta hydrolase [Sinorhizobium sojae]ASY65034.1 2-hydroxymuconic semialdehyde hydrolase [Sinorhizobium sojae CCBAU 05684]